MTTGTEPTDTNPDGRIERASRPPEPVLRVVNPILGWVLRSPLHWLASESILLLTVTGRRSGREYTFPVLYESEGGTLYVTSFGTNWWKNLREGGQEVTVHLRGERRRGHAEVEEDDQAVAAYVHDYLETQGADAAGQVGIELPGGEVPPVEVLEDAVDHVVLVTIDLEEP